MKAESIINRDFYKAFIEDEMKGKIEIELANLWPLGYYDNDIVDNGACEPV